MIEDSGLLGWLYTSTDFAAAKLKRTELARAEVRAQGGARAPRSYGVPV